VTDVPGSAPTAGGDQEVDVVELGVPARTAYVSVLRTTAAALAARLDFTLDEIEDLRIAVDEASALLLSQAIPDSQLTCRFELAGDELTVSVSVRSRNPRVPSRNSFAWTVLTALAGKVETSVDPDEQRATVTLTKRGEAVRRPRHDTSSAEVRKLDEARQARSRRASDRAGAPRDSARGSGTTQLPSHETGAVEQ
jgi:serine/threonine-protein kinase RsbW